MTSGKVVRAVGLLLATGVLFAQEKVDLLTVHRIRQEAFQNSKVMEHLFYLTDVNGPRVTGTEGYDKAAQWAVTKLKSFGIDNAHTEVWGKFGRGWSYKKFGAHMVEPSYAPLIGFPLAWTPGTKGATTAETILAPMSTDADLEKYKGKLKGKIVMVTNPRAISPMTTAPMKRYTAEELEKEQMASEMSPAASPFGFLGLPAAGPAMIGPNANAGGGRRGGGGPFNLAFREKLRKFLIDEGAIAVVSSSFTGDGGTVFGAQGGSRELKDGIPLPSVVLTPEHYNRLVRLMEMKITPKIELDIQAEVIDKDLDSANVVAEIEGGSKKDEIVMIGAHLDSWQGGTGATDNGAGTAVMIEVMRIIKALNLKLDRTVRIALWSGEESGLLGSRGYVKNHFADPTDMKLKPEHGKVSAYYNLDNGTGRIRGVYLQGNDMVRPVFESYLAPFKDLGATTISIRNTGGTDHLSFDAVGIPGFQFIQDPVEYSTRTHHSNMDLYDYVQKEDLQQAAAIIASFVYNTANRADMLPRKPLPKARPAERTEVKSPVTAKGTYKENVEYTDAGGKKLLLDAWTPEGAGPFPAAIIVHGGGFIRGDKRTYVPPMFEPLAKGGIAWFSIDYRLSGDGKFPAQIDDVDAAIKYVKAHAAEYKVDVKKIALVGESAGGHLVSYAGAKFTPETRVAAVVSFYGPHDLTAHVKANGKPSEGLAQMLDIKEPLDAAAWKKLKDSSPISYVKKDMPPYLLIHGTADKQVGFARSEEMCAKMKAKGASCELFTVTDAPHGIGGWEQKQEFQAYKEKMVQWLKNTLTASK